MSNTIYVDFDIVSDWCLHNMELSNITVILDDTEEYLQAKIEWLNDNKIKFEYFNDNKIKHLDNIIQISSNPQRFMKQSCVKILYALNKNVKAIINSSIYSVSNFEQLKDIINFYNEYDYKTLSKKGE